MGYGPGVVTAAVTVQMDGRRPPLSPNASRWAYSCISGWIFTWFVLEFVKAASARATSARRSARSAPQHYRRFGGTASRISESRWHSHGRPALSAKLLLIHFAARFSSVARSARVSEVRQAGHQVLQILAIDGQIEAPFCMAVAGQVF